MAQSDGITFPVVCAPEADAAPAPTFAAALRRRSGGLPPRPVRALAARTAPPLPRRAPALPR
jgi:hypothetical protein